MPPTGRYKEIIGALVRKTHTAFVITVKCVLLEQRDLGARNQRVFGKAKILKAIPRSGCKGFAFLSGLVFEMPY